MSNRNLNILERLANGPVVGDGSICFTLEKRGYCKAGPWTPEAVIEFPEAVKQLQREYLRAGSDVIQTASFYASDDKMSIGVGENEVVHTTKELNDAACRIATEVATEGNALVCGSLSPVPSFSLGKPQEEVEHEFAKQVHVYEEHKVDFVLGEFFGNIKEVEIAVKIMKKLKIPIGVTMRIGPLGDENGISVEECAVRMAKTGAAMIGVNCLYDVNTCLKTLKRMKNALDKAELNPYLICQPLGYFCPEVEDNIDGYIALPEAPLCLESRQMTRIDAHKFARAAWKIGVRYIGGCCGMEPHHIRAIAQELKEERKKVPPVNEMCKAFGEDLKLNAFGPNTSRTTREYWYKVKVGSGRPFNAPLTGDLCEL